MLLLQGIEFPYETFNIHVYLADLCPATMNGVSVTNTAWLIRQAGRHHTEICFGEYSLATHCNLTLNWTLDGLYTCMYIILQPPWWPPKL